MVEVKAGATKLPNNTCTYTCMVTHAHTCSHTHTQASHRQLLADFLVLLFDVVERVKTDSNRLLRCMACECLRELEMTYPGMLSDKVGHFYGMSLAETTHIHQSYMVRWEGLGSCFSGLSVSFFRSVNFHFLPPSLSPSLPPSLPPSKALFATVLDNTLKKVAAEQRYLLNCTCMHVRALCMSFMV